jgi:hypothetical protein
MIYFAQAEDSGHIKIGFTSGSAEGRIQDLQVGSSSRLILLAVVSGSKADEKVLHQQLSRDRIRGEWFRPTPDVLRLMADAVRFGGVPPRLALRLPAERDFATHLIALLTAHGSEVFSLRGPTPGEAGAIKDMARDFCQQGGSCHGLRRVFDAVFEWAEAHFSRREAGLALAQLEWRFDGVGGWYA